MAPATSTHISEICDLISSSGYVFIGKQQHYSQIGSQSSSGSGSSLLIQTPVSYCLLRGMSNSIGGGIGKSVRAVLSAFSNLEGEEEEQCRL